MKSIKIKPWEGPLAVATVTASTIGDHPVTVTVTVTAHEAIKMIEKLTECVVRKKYQKISGWDELAQKWIDE